MKNLANYFNPKITHIDLQVTVNLGVAYEYGWESSDLYEGTRRGESDDMGDLPITESYEDATKIRLKAHQITVYVTGDKRAPNVVYTVTSAGEGVKMDTGGTEKCIKDCIQWIGSGVAEVTDRSFEENGGTYQPAFSQFETQKKDMTILNRYSGELIFAGEFNTILEALLSALLNGVDLRDVDLRDVDLRNADLSDADLQDADLRGALLRGTNLRGALLRGADLRGANLRGAVLRNAVLRNADLRGADLRDADLSGADFIGANLEGVIG